ncbi:hypothetical protein HN011_005044 [Eciton burchellii]|nr:hypothetical protein HN011_005044 [Eciton burchellii]
MAAALKSRMRMMFYAKYPIIKQITKRGVCFKSALKSPPAAPRVISSVSLLRSRICSLRVTIGDARGGRHRYNVSKTAIFRNDAYLPPAEVPDFSLPEVIDNRARNAIANESRGYPNLPYFPERDSSRALTRKGSQDTRNPGRDRLQTSQRPRRPVSSPQDKHPRRTTTPPPPPAETPMSSLANRISIEEMSCQNSRDELFFRASIKAPRILHPPIIDNAMGEVCQAVGAKDSYRINFEGNQVWDCGVVDCSAEGNQSYCLDLRFPVISGLRLKDDYRVTLRCKIQDRIAYHTRRISVKTLETKARSIPSVLNGGSENSLNVDMGLFRKTYGSKNIFDTRIQSGSTVVLGEEILLRVLVNGDDGWRHSKIGQVTMHYVEERQQQRIINSLWILDKSGCLNSDVREICPREQYTASPLESYLIFQAFMFEGMKETDEIFLTVKATACLEAADCVLDCPAGHIRRARSVLDRNNTVEWQDDMILRVVLPRYELHNLQNHYLAIILSLVTISVLILLMWILKILFHRKIAKS